MLPLFALALLPLDLANPAAPAAAADGLRLVAAVEDGVVVADLDNVGARPLQVMVGYSCGGPTPFEAVIDGAARPFVTPVRACDKNVTVLRLLPPRGRLRVASERVLLDGQTHRVEVRYR